MMENIFGYAMRKLIYSGKLKKAAVILVVFGMLITVGEAWSVWRYEEYLSQASMHFEPASPLALWVGYSMFSAVFGIDWSTAVIQTAWEVFPLMVIPLFLGLCGTELYNEDRKAGVSEILYIRCRRGSYYWQQGTAAAVCVSILIALYLLVQLGLSIPVTFCLKDWGIGFSSYTWDIKEIGSVLSAICRQCLFYGAITLFTYSISLYMGRFQNAVVMLPLVLSLSSYMIFLRCFQCSPHMMAYVEPKLAHPNISVYVYFILGLTVLSFFLLWMKQHLWTKKDCLNEVLR